MSNKVTILGVNGRIGEAAARAFAAAGWQVTGFGRSDRVRIPGVTFFAGDANDVAAMRRACTDAQVVVNALNLPYDAWDKGRAEAQLQGVLDALAGMQTTLLFPGNIYNYGEDQHLITPDTPQHPARDKGEIRKRMEGMLVAASQKEGLQVLIVRAGDFYGPGVTGTYFDMALLARLKSGIVQYPADPATWHSWAYLPDLGRAYVRIAEARQTLPRFEAFEYRGHFESGEKLLAIVRSTLGRPVKVRRMPWGLLRLLGLFMPMMRELYKMSYLWVQPHQMRDEKLDALLGPDFSTSFETAIRATVTSYLPGAKTEPAGAVAASRP